MAKEQLTRNEQAENNLKKAETLVEGGDFKKVVGEVRKKLSLSEEEVADVKLINAYFDGELSKEEEQAVYDRINEDKDFREHFELIEVLLSLRAKKRISDLGLKNNE